MNTTLSISDDICDICEKPGFLEHTDCLLKFTGSLLNDVFANMDSDSFTDLTMKIPTISNTSNTSISSNIDTSMNTIETISIHKLVCRVPVQYYDQFKNKIYYKANSKKLKNVRNYMREDPNFEEFEINYKGYIKDIKITVNLDVPNYWYINVNVIGKDLDGDKLPTIYKSLKDGLQTTLAMFTTEFKGDFEFVSFR